MEDSSVDIIFTSPPYNRKRNDKYSYYDDTLTDYYGFLNRFIKEALRVSKRHCFINLQKNYYNKRDVLSLIGAYCKDIVEVIVWEKTNPLPASGLSVTNAYELFLVLGDSALKSNSTYTKNIIHTSVNTNMPKIHKAVMKQEVSDWFIENFTKKTDTILDPFAGLGTTGASCLKYGRNFIGIEIVKEYFEEMQRRLSDGGVKSI